MVDDKLPLFEWKPQCRFIQFPLKRQIGKVRDVARKLDAKWTDKSARHYRLQTDEALRARLGRLGLPEKAIEKEIDEFWQAVDQEMVRLEYANAQNGDAG